MDGKDKVGRTACAPELVATRVPLRPGIVHSFGHLPHPSHPDRRVMGSVKPRREWLMGYGQSGPCWQASADLRVAMDQHAVWSHALVDTDAGGSSLHMIVPRCRAFASTLTPALQNTITIAADLGL